MGSRGALVARGKLRIPRGQVRRGDVAADLAREDGTHDLLDGSSGGRPRDAELHHLSGALEDRLVGVHVPRRYLTEKSFGGDGVLGVHCAHSREVHGAVREWAAEKRQLLEGTLGQDGLARRTERERAQPFRGEGLRLPRKQLQGLLSVPHLQLGRGLLQRAGNEIGGQLRVAEDGAANELLLQVVLIGIAYFRACGNAAHEEGRNEENGGSEAHRT